MRMVKSRLTVYFDDPFWVGVYEREADGRYEACKITFGAEPKDCEVYAFLLENWRRLRFSTPVKAARNTEAKCLNPKRERREIARTLQMRGTGTKAQQALAAQHSEGKAARKAASRAEKEREAAERYALRTQKRKEKHRGH